jgi:septal ring factor EnvC (AmiA/AmiB activator)
MNPIAWLQSRVQYAALAGAAAFALVAVMVLGWVLLTTNWTLNRTRGDLRQSRQETAQANQALGTCQANTSNLQAALAEQNTAIQTLKLEAEESEKAGLRRLAEAKQEAARYRTRADQLAKAKPGPDQCVSAQQLIVTTLSGDRP